MKVGHVFGSFLALALVVVSWLIAERIYNQYLIITADPLEDQLKETELTAVTPLPAEKEISFPALEEFAGIVERPLFSQTRRPKKEVREVARASPPAKFDFDLVGIVIWQSKRNALVRSKAGGDIVKLEEGEVVAGWTAVDISPDHVSFWHDGAEHELRLQYKDALKHNGDAK